VTTDPKEYLATLLVVAAIAVLAIIAVMALFWAVKP